MDHARSESFGGKVVRLHQTPQKRQAKMRNIWTLSLLALLAQRPEVCSGEDVFVEGTASAMGLGAGGEEGYPSGESSPGNSRADILAAQFECYMRINLDPPRPDNGTFCQRTWDGWLCWPDSEPGVVLQRCPTYFQDFDPSEKVTKVCNPDGQWFHHPESNKVWSNYTQCSAYTLDNLKMTYSMLYLAMLGHGLSIVSLIISMIIFSYFKSLGCQRVSVHKNTFMSYILNSVGTVIWLSTIANNQELVASNPISCKVLSVVIHYTLASNVFWMLCEGLYLHTLITVAVFVGEQNLVLYYILGWGFPIIPALMFALGRGMYYNDNCWISSDTSLLYIIHIPAYVALLVNLFILLNVVRVLFTKLKVTHSAETTAYTKAVRATLILVPLLGVHYILVPIRPKWRLASAVYEFTMNICSHFQGLLVAIIFCFCNTEAQTALRRKWAQQRMMWVKNPISTTFHSNSVYTSCSFTTGDTSCGTRSPEPSETLALTAPTELGPANGQQTDGRAGPQQQTPGLESAVDP